MQAAAIERMRMHPVPPEAAARAEALQVARQFEAVFVRSMIGNLRQTAQVMGEGGGLFGSGPGADTYADWFDQNLAEHIGEHGNVGVADVLMREFERWKQIPPRPPEARGPALHALRPGLPRPGDVPAGSRGGIDVAA
jgi:flagellar protein FlgJ